MGLNSGFMIQVGGYGLGFRVHGFRRSKGSGFRVQSLMICFKNPNVFPEGGLSMESSSGEP